MSSSSSSCLHTPRPFPEPIEKQRALSRKQMNRPAHQRLELEKNPKGTDSLTTERLRDVGSSRAEADITWPTVRRSKIISRSRSKEDVSPQRTEGVFCALSPGNHTR
jgi:hypothetical protein